MSTPAFSCKQKFTHSQWWKLIHFSHKNVFRAISLVFIWILLVSNMQIFGQAASGSGIAVYVKITDKSIPDGSVISFSNAGYHLSPVAYDPTAFGVVNNNPAASLEEPQAGLTPVVSEGKVRLRVTAINGAIKQGDLLTTSKVLGVAQKVSQDGYVVGSALESYNNTNPNKEGRIWVSLNFGFNSQATGLRTNLLENLHTALKSPFLSPAATFRYILAALVVIICLGAGLWFFGRVAGRGVEALGRNPLASKQILIGISFNLILCLVILAVGLAIAYLILIL